MAAEVTRDFTATSRVTDDNRVFEIEVFEQARQIVRISVHIVSAPSLSRAAVPAAVVCDYAKTLLAEEQHLAIPIVRGEWPAVAENDRLSFAPVFVKNFGAVFGGDSRHGELSFALVEFGWNEIRGIAYCYKKQDFCAANGIIVRPR